MIINRVPRPKRFGRKIFERIEYKINYKIASSMINKKKKKRSYWRRLQKLCSTCWFYLN